MKLKSTPALLACFDLIGFVAAFGLSYVLAESVSTDLLDREYIHVSQATVGAWIWLYVAVMSASMTLFGSKGHYTQRQPWWEQVKYMVVVCSLMMLLTGSVMYVLKLPFSRMWVVCCFAMAVPLLVIMRLIVRRIALAMGRWGCNVMIIGGPENTLETIYALTSDVYNLYHVKEIYLLGTNSTLDVESLPSQQRKCKQSLAKSDQLLAFIKKSKCRLVIAAPDENTRLDIVAITETVQASGREVAFIPPMHGMSMYGMDVQHFFGSHTVLLKPKRRVEKRLNRIFKRSLDLIGASCGLLALSVPIAVIAYMIRKDGGPAFYYQERIGRDGVPFKCWKLRSMVPNAKEILEQLLATDAEARKEWETDFKLKNDPRITKIGRVIRKTSIDELPQLWNVLRGDMSLVGPRPIIKKELDYYGKNAADYLTAKPGLTGLWQVSGRNDTSYAYRVYLDSWYVAHWSLWTDIVIIIMTIGILVNRKGAY